MWACYKVTGIWIYCKDRINRISDALNVELKEKEGCGLSREEKRGLNSLCSSEAYVSLDPLLTENPRFKTEHKEIREYHKWSRTSRSCVSVLLYSADIKKRSQRGNPISQNSSCSFHSIFTNATLYEVVHTHSDTRKS